MHIFHIQTVLMVIDIVKGTMWTQAGWSSLRREFRMCFIPRLNDLHRTPSEPSRLTL